MVMNGTGHTDIPGEIFIRDAVMDDLHEIVRLEQLAFENPWTLDGYMKELESHSSVLRVAVHGGRGGGIIGVICFRIVAGEGYLMKLHVAERYRRQGVGSCMLRMFIDFCHSKGVGEVVLDVSASNLVARAFYAGKGFITAGHDAPSGVSSFIMTRRLNCGDSNASRTVDNTVF